MSRLDSILNPELGLNQPRLASPLTEGDHLSLPSSSVSASPLTQNVPPIPLPPLEGPLGGRYRHHVGALGEHDAHETCPDALNCLPDTEGRPQHTLPIILRCAILGSPKKRMTIREIYAAMEEKYPYYRTAGQTWKQSVRHHLSLNRLFERQPRPVTDPGFGSYWTVNLDAPPGTKRPRKRGRPNREQPDGANPRKRGRPRKVPDTDAGTSAKGEQDDYSDIEPPISGLHRMNMDGGMSYEDGMDYMPDEIPRLRSVRADEYDDDDDGTPPPNTLGMVLGPNPFSVSPGGTRGPFPDNMNILDRLKQEMDNMRRREASAMAERQRMSDQLAEAQADASRARAAQRAAEKMLREEETLRRDEERLRRDAEGQLREMQVRLSDTLRSPDGNPL